MRRPVGDVGHPDLLERAAHPRVELGAGHAEVGRSEGDVLGDGRQEELVVRVLEDDADPAPDLAQAAPAEPVRPPTRTTPLPPSRIPFRCRTSVVLPAPFGPSSATRSPVATRSDTWCSAADPSG